MTDLLANPPASRLIVDHATCLACGCLCDDIRVEVEEGRIVEAAHACPIGRGWFLAPRPGEGHPAATIEGRPVELDEAIDRAAEILRAAKAPVVWGLSGTTIEAARSALAIADNIGAVVDPSRTDDEESARLAAFQRVGLVSASLGEVKDRADLVVFWGVDPVLTHPRHWERYSVEPRGRFVPEGRAGRFVIVADTELTATGRQADLFIPINPDRQAETLEALRAFVKGVRLDPDRVQRSTGMEGTTLEALAARMMEARHGAFFFGPKLHPFALAFHLIRALNDGRRFVALELGGPGNPAGASAIIGWQTGFSQAVDLGLGFPRHLPAEATLSERMARHEVDAVLMIGDDPAEFLSSDQVVELGEVPSIVIAPGATRGERWPTVGIDVARPGIEAGGTVARVDGVMLPLRPSINFGLPTDRRILDAIAGRLGVSR
jgi:formylmethanofuran dehydrogenase subunit B